MAVIYKATNTINGKAYIGHDKDWPSRIKEHLNKALHGGEYFHNALAKYGADKFEWTILVEDATYEDEIKMISEHRTFENGYNLTKGGEGKLGYITSEETKKKISDAAKKRLLTTERLDILRNNAERMRGKTRPAEECARISTALKGKIKTEAHRKAISENHATHKETGAFYISSEYKEKMSNSLKGKKRTPEQKERYRQAALNRKKK